MAKSLPPRPDLEWLKKTAKQQLADLRAHDGSAKLHHAQHAIAEEYGFKSWRALKAHVDAASLDGEIIAAAVAGKADELAALLDEHPAKLRITGGAWNRPLLHLAAEARASRLRRAAAAARAHVDLRDRGDNATALHWAAQGGHLPVMERLLAAGADIDGEGDAARGRRDRLGHLLPRCARRCSRVSAGARRQADHLLGRRARPRRPGAATRRADRSLVAAKMSRFEQHRTPLHLAVLKNRPQMVALLLELGADPSARDDSGSTPLNLVAAMTDKSIAGLLIKAGANPEERGVSRFLSSVPILNVRSVPASIDYYVHKLGFEKEWDWGDPPTFACVRRDQVRIFLCQGAQGAPGTWISIFVQNVDALYEDYQRRGARHPPGADQLSVGRARDERTGSGRASPAPRQRCNRAVGWRASGGGGVTMASRYRRARRIALRDLNRPACKTHRCPGWTPLRSRVTPV